MGEGNGRLERALRDLILKREFAGLPLKQQLEYLCKAICREIDVARVGVWSLVENGTAIISEVEWDANKNTSTAGTELREEDAAAYLAALKQEIVLTINDALNDPCCAELAQSYLPNNCISSLLDCPMRDADGLIGVLCVEHVGDPREWTKVERAFVMAITCLASLCFEGQARRDAETAKADREQRLRQFAEMSTGWMIELDATLKLVSVIGDEPIEDLEIASLINRHPWDSDQLRPLSGNWGQLRTRMEAAERLQDIILISPAKAGGAVYTELSARPEYDDDGNFAGYIGVAKDVSARIRSQIELRDSEQRYRSASRLGRFGSWIWDEVENRMSYCSPELAQIYGVTGDEYVAQSRSVEGDLEWYHPDDRERYEQVIRQAVRNESGYEITARIVRKDGTIRHLHEWTEAVFDEAGRFVATAGVLLDITDRVELQDKFRENAERLRSLVDNLPGAVFRVEDSDGWPTTYLSGGYYRTFIVQEGDSADTINADPQSAMYIDTEFEERVHDARRRSIDENRPYEIEYRITMDSSKPKWVWERGRPVTNSEGQAGLEGLLLDVTEKRNAQEALTRSQRLEAVGQLTGGIAHDFNNLLAVILGNLEIVGKKITEPAIVAMLNNCINATQRGADLTRSMLAFAKRTDLQATDLELNAVIEASRSWIGRTLPANIHFNTQLSADLWGVKADLAGTETALLNLILNARDAMPAGGKLTIKSENAVIADNSEQGRDLELESGNYVVLSVIDSGTGIPQESLSKIFEPFHTTKEPGEGTGLGLSMIKGFMEQSGGRVTVASKSGVGTTFRLFFPRSEAEGGRVSASGSVGPTRAKHAAKLLVVEDEPAVLDVLRLSLELAGYEVVGASNSGKALEEFRANNDFDLVITDILLPGTRLGPELAKEIRAIRSDIPIIFVSGCPERSSASASTLTDNVVRLTKPLRSADLIACIERMLGG